jgi:UDP-MurNAc hydroxylase
VKFEWYTNACVRISADSGNNVLCDPWTNEGAFLGSWFHWPPIDSSLETALLAAPCNGIYISHLHPDHYDPKFIAKFSKQRPDVPIYIAKFSHPWLLRSLKSILSAKTPLIELPLLTDFRVASDLVMNVFAADTCNPSICGINVSCQVQPNARGIDSVAVFKADSQSIVNANDAMGINLVPKIAAHIGSADVLLGHYGGASPFPQCFIDVKDKQAAAEAVVDSTCKMLISAADAINAKYVMPFAGQYVLGGKLVNLNDDRATIPLDSAVIKLRTMTNRKVLSIMPGGEINLSPFSKSADYVEPSNIESAEYLKKISQTTFSYEKKSEATWDSSAEDLNRSALKVVEKSKGTKLPYSNSFVIGDGENTVTINLDKFGLESNVRAGEQPAYETVTTILVPPGLLRNLSSRRANYKGFTSMHWNQADVGSHFIWQRRGNFEPISHSFLNYFGT